MQMSTLILTNAEKSYRKVLLKPVGDGPCRKDSSIWAGLWGTEWKILVFILHFCELTVTACSAGGMGGKSQGKLLAGKQWDYTVFLAKAAL